MNITTITNNKALKAIGNEPFKFLSIKDIRDCRKSNIQKTETLVVKSLCCDILTCFFFTIYNISVMFGQEIADISTKYFKNGQELQKQKKIQ